MKSITIIEVSRMKNSDGLPKKVLIPSYIVLMYFNAKN